MSRKIALKRLSSSDLSLFKVYYDQHPTSRQKGINLNADVLIDRFYPDLPSPVEVQLVINGPGITTIPDRLVRYIARPAKGKNRRLQATLIPNPAGTARYTPLAKDDLALLEFFDDVAGRPHSIIMTLISASTAVAEDAAAFSALTGLVQLSLPGNKRTMVALSPAILESTLSSVLPAGHPLQAFLTDEAELELLAEGGDVEPDEMELETPATPTGTMTPAGTPAPRKARVYKPKDFNKTAKPSVSRISHEAMAKAKAAATDNGEKGEELVNRYLTGSMASGEFEWSSRDNAYAPYDFLLKPAGKQIMVDVKTTIENLERAIHISINELRQAASAPDEYQIYRVYDVKGTPKMCISGNLRDFAAGLLLHVAALPPGVIADGFTLKPSMLTGELSFGAAITLPAVDE